MLRRFSSLVIPIRGIKHTVPFKWVRPDYVPSYKPVRSGDLEPKDNVPETSLGEFYALSDEITDAPESVKKIFSVAFLGRKQQCDLVKKQVMGRVKRHQYDVGTAETIIARMTAQIRCLQDTLEKYPRNVVAKVAAQELIDKRKKKLKFLRIYDYKKFEWLLEKLNIQYKAHPETYHKLSRKESLRRLTEMHCEDIRQKKLDDYRNLLESQQGPYLKKKLETLKFIRQEQEELGIPITINKQDIQKVEQALDEWAVRDEAKRQAKRKKKQIIFD